MKSSRNVLRSTRFANARLDPVGLEVLSLKSLRERAEALRLSEAERVDFFVLILPWKGHGEHIVDFERIPLHPGRVVFVRPGQVQQWSLGPRLEAYVLLIQPSALAPLDMTKDLHSANALLHLEDWPSSFDLDQESHESVLSWMRTLGSELARTPLTALSTALGQQLLLCLLLVLSRSAASGGADHSVGMMLIRDFRRMLDESIYLRPSVNSMARRLGVSTSTLSRSCQLRLGRSAKGIIDQRLVLEAQRLLVHTDQTSVAIGERLGFSEPTNFVKFFRRLANMPPEAFRKAHRL